MPTSPTITQWFRILVPFLCSLLIIGCAGQQVASTDNIQSAAARKAESRVVTPQEALAVAEQEMKKAESENLAFFSPLHLAQAEEQMALARQYSKTPKPGEPNAGIEAAISAIEFLKKGFTNKADVQVYLKEAIAHKRLLQKLGVPERYPDAYKEVLYQFSQLIKTIEEGAPDVALYKQKPMRSRMYELEIAALNDIHLGEAKRILAQAEENDAERFAPSSFANAEYKIRTTEAYIQENYRDRSGIKEAGDQALLLAQLAHEVGIESKKVMNMDSAASEEYVLFQIQRLQDYSNLMAAGTLPPQSIERSALDIRKAIQKLIGEKEAALAKLSKLEAELEKFNAISTSPFIDTLDSEVSVVETLDKKELSDPPALQEDEQGFDSVEFVEDN